MPELTQPAPAPDVPVEVTVVVPAFNEARNIGSTVTAIREYLSATSAGWQIVVVDDGSTDETARVTAEAARGFPGIELVSNGTNRGKGYSIRRGMSAARGRVALYCDADLSTPIADLEVLRAALQQGFDVAIGSRAVSGARILRSQPWHRVLMGKVFNRLMRLITGLDFRDTQCGFKAFNRRAYQAVFPRQTIDGFGFDVEVVAIAESLSFAVAEVPVHWRNDPDSRVRVLIDPLRMLVDLFRVRAARSKGRWERAYAARGEHLAAARPGEKS